MNYKNKNLKTVNFYTDILMDFIGKKYGFVPASKTLLLLMHTLSEAKGIKLYFSLSLMITIHTLSA